MNACSVTPIGLVVRKLFAFLDEQEIAWAVLRGSDGLPDDTRYDIDILVDSADLKRTESLVERAAASCGWRKLRIVNKYQYRCWLLVSPGPEPCFLPIDLFGGCYHRFYPFAEARRALEHRRRNVNGVWIVPPGFGAWVALAKELMRHDTFKENSRDEVRRGVMEDGDNFISAASPFLGAAPSRRLLEACVGNNWDIVGKTAVFIRQQIGKQRLRNLPGAAAFFFKNILHHLRTPMSMFVVLLGPDGAGKSTVGDEVCERLYHRPFKICQRYEYNFKLLPHLKSAKHLFNRLIGRKTILRSVPPGTKGSGMNKEHGKLRGMLYVTYYSVDLLLGHLVLRKLRAQGSLVLFARYFYDYYFQKGYANVPCWYLNFLNKLIPKPDAVLYLHRDANEIYSGKPELDVDEIQRQQTRIGELLKRLPNGVIVDASKGIEATVESVDDIILEKLLSSRAFKNAG